MEKMKGRNIILVEDIIDTGKTMQALIPYFESYGVRSVVVCIKFLFKISYSYSYSYSHYVTSMHFHNSVMDRLVLCLKKILLSAVVTSAIIAAISSPTSSLWDMVLTTTRLIAIWSMCVLLTITELNISRKTTANLSL